MNADGARQVRRRTKDGRDDTDPAWFDPAFVPVFAVAPVGKIVHDVGVAQTDRPITAIIEKIAFVEICRSV